MWLQFLLENAHFALNLLAALVFFAVFWLYWDAWRVRRKKSEMPKLAGFFLLSLSFILHAVQVETTIVTDPFFAKGIIETVGLALRIGGYILLLAGLGTEPIGRKPHALILVGLTAAVPQLFVPVLASLVGFFYMRRATVGLEDHLKPVSFAFFGIALAELIHLVSLFANTSLISLYRLVAPFGFLWILSHIIMLFSVLYLRKWVFGYLLKQFETQLFMTFTSSILIIFLLTTVSFTGLLVKNIQDEALHQLETDVAVLSFALESQKTQLTSDVQVIAQDGAVVTGVGAVARKELSDIVVGVLLTKKLNTLVVVSDTGLVLSRGEDRDRVGDSLSDDPLIKRALLGETASSVGTRDGVVAPAILLQSATPIKDNNSIIGAVIGGVAVDSAFVDGIKSATGLDASIYADAVVSATTFVTPDGKARLTGLKETSERITKRVLADGKSYSGTVTIAQVPHFASYLPIRDVDTNPVGMLFVGRPEISVLQTAGRSIELTFLVTVVLLLLSIIPAHRIARGIAEQIS